MPQNDKSHATIGRSDWEGKTIEPANREELNEAIRLAFDYRGDTTLVLKDGNTVEGFVFNHDPATGMLQIFIKDGKESTPATVNFDDIGSVFFSGADTAFGQSWDAWQSKSAKQRAAEAERLRQKAAELGHL